MTNQPVEVKEQFNFNHRIPNPLVFSAFNQEQAIQIDRLHGIRSLTLYAHGNMCVVNANNATATTEPRFITDMRLTVGGGTVLWAGDWQGLYRINNFEYGVVPPYTGLNGNNAAFAVSSVVIMDLQYVWGTAPIDTALISRLFSSIELRARCGGVTDLQGGADNVTFVDFRIDVTLNEVVNLKDGFGRFVKKVSYVERALTASQTEFIIPLPTGNMIKKVWVRSFRNSEPAAGIINNIKVMVGGEVLYDEDVTTCRGEQQLRDLMNTNPTAYHEINFNPDDILSEGANLSKVASLGANLVLDVTAGNPTVLIRAMVMEILPLR